MSTKELLKDAYKIQDDALQEAARSRWAENNYKNEFNRLEKENSQLKAQLAALPAAQPAALPAAQPAAL